MRRLESGLTVFDRRGRSVGRRTYPRSCNRRDRRPAAGGARRSTGRPRRRGPSHLVRLVRRLARRDSPRRPAGRDRAGRGGRRQPGAAGQAARRRRQPRGRAHRLDRGPGRRSSPRSRRARSTPPACITPAALAATRPRQLRGHPQPRRTPHSCSSPAARPASRARSRSLMAAPSTTRSPSTSTSRRRTARLARLHRSLGVLGSALPRHGPDLEPDSDAQGRRPSPHALRGVPRPAAAWLELLASGGRSVATAPNFGYQLCVDRIKDKELEGPRPLELAGCLLRRRDDSAGNGLGFLDKFGRCGFRPESYRPWLRTGRGDPGGRHRPGGPGPGRCRCHGPADGGFELREVFCLGEPVLDTRIEITAPDGSALPEGQVGEVRIQGPQRLLGLLQRP